MRVSIVLALLCGVSCGGAAPLEPAPPAAMPAFVSLEGEAGAGDGHLLERSRASGGKTVHLGPGQERRWTLKVTGAMDYRVSVTYSNSRWGENEMITVSVDGVALRPFKSIDTGEDTEGWNTFVTEPLGASSVAPGPRVITVAVAGGDGCVEIDRVNLQR